MGNLSPAAILYDANGNPVAVQDGHPASSDRGVVVRAVERTVPTFYAVFDRVTMAADKYLATLFNTSATRKAVVQRVWVYNNQFDRVAGGDIDLELLRITARTAGSAVTPRAEDTADSLSAGIVADTNSTAVSESHLVRRILSSGEEIGFSSSDAQSLLALPVFALRYERRTGQRGLVLRQNEGITLKFVDGDDDGTVSVVYEFTDEVA